jgi:GNAT superfamily N-acetyltransferase
VRDDDGIVLGFAVLMGNLLSKLYVHPDASGRGIGRALLAATEDLARSRGVTRMRLKATVNGEPFYAAHGYVALRRETVGPDAAPVTAMVKRLTSASSERPSEASG